MTDRRDWTLQRPERCDALAKLITSEVLTHLRGVPARQQQTVEFTWDERLPVWEASPGVRSS
jgi:hypothetical protein